jgi:prepilin-type N-terminal cleavage/methylation domain-containing protein
MEASAVPTPTPAPDLWSTPTVDGIEQCLRGSIVLALGSAAWCALTDRLPHRRLRRGGFTLLELIVVLVILGLLSAIAIPTFAAAIDRAELQGAEATILAHTRAAEAESLGSQTSMLVDDTGPGWPFGPLDNSQVERPLIYWDWLNAGAPVVRAVTPMGREQLVTGFLPDDTSGPWPSMVARTTPLPGPAAAIPGTCVEFWVTHATGGAGAGASRVVEHAPPRRCEMAAPNALPPLP